MNSTFFQIFLGRNGRNEFLPLSSTRPEESHFFRKKLNPATRISENSTLIDNVFTTHLISDLSAYKYIGYSHK